MFRFYEEGYKAETLCGTSIFFFLNKTTIVSNRLCTQQDKEHKGLSSFKCSHAPVQIRQMDRQTFTQNLCIHVCKFNYYYCSTCTTGKMCRKYSIRGLKLHGVWTVILLTYTHTVYTVMSILNCPRIPTGNGIKNVRL